MFFKKRGQAALEFLMTYAWAILIVIVIIGVLAYSGVFNADTLIPDRCTFNGGLSCKDFSYTYSDTGNTGTITLILTNGLGKTVQINMLNFTSEKITGGNDLTACGTDYTASPIQIDNGNSAALTVTAAGCYPIDKGGKIRLKGIVSYQYAETTALPHRIDGELFAKPISQ